MKALVLEEYNRFSYKDVPGPKVGAGDVLIKIVATAICGSDVHGYDGASGRRKPPMIPGHEASGIVTEVGSDVAKYKKGDRVVFNSTLYCRECDFCRRGQLNMCADGKVFGVSCDSYHLEGAMCEYIAVPEYIVYPLPDNVSFEQAALIEPMSIALHAINNTPICLNDRAVIFGAGTIGMLMLKVLKISSCGEVIIVDLDEDKLKKAKNMGADVCINPGQTDAVQKINQISNGQGADIALEAVGVNATFNSALACLKKGGALTMVGNVSPRLDFPLQTAVMREIAMHGSYGCSTEYGLAIELLASERIDISDCISAIASLHEGQQWFDRLHAGEKGLLKVVLKP